MDDNATATATLLSAHVAEEVRALMARRRISGRKLAELLDVSPSWVSYRMTGVTPIGLDDLQKIAGVLAVEVASLLPRPSEGRVLTTVGDLARHQGAHPNERSRRPTKRPGPFSHPKRTQPDTATRRPGRRIPAHA